MEDESIEVEEQQVYGESDEEEEEGHHEDGYQSSYIMGRAIKEDSIGTAG